MSTPAIILNSSLATWIAARSVADLAGVGLHIADELRNGLRRERWIYLHDKGVADDARDRCDVVDEVETELVVESGVDRVRRRHEEQRVTVRGRAHDGFGGDIGGCPGPVFDDELLAEPLGQPLTDQARGDVGGAAGGKTDDQAHRPRRIVLRSRQPRYGRQRGSARCQTEKISTGKFHLNLPPASHHSITSSARASSVVGISNNLDRFAHTAFRLDGQ
jgi:hypothetical protein